MVVDITGVATFQQRKVVV